jgi:hypothetical protein
VRERAADAEGFVIATALLDAGADARRDGTPPPREGRSRSSNC